MTSCLAFTRRILQSPTLPRVSDFRALIPPFILRGTPCRLFKCRMLALGRWKESDGDVYPSFLSVLIKASFCAETPESAQTFSRNPLVSAILTGILSKHLSRYVWKRVKSVPGMFFRTQFGKYLKLMKYNFFFYTKHLNTVFSHF